MRSSGDAIRPITVRVPAVLHEAAKRLAARRGVSINEVFRIALRRMAEQERFEALRESYDALGCDADSDVEPYVRAQRELARRG